MLKVLLVDDEPFILQGLSALINWENEGYEIVYTCSNGKEALDYLIGNKVDLIIADIKMPVMSGIELLKNIREKNITDAFFVFLSGYGDFVYTKEAIQQNATDYILKPVTQKEQTDRTPWQSFWVCVHCKAGEKKNGSYQALCIILKERKAFL